MSNYSKVTDFASKDALSTGNPAKIVKGTEIDDELTAISGAIATKADTASPTLTGTPAAPTASAGTNTTQISTTAFVTTAIAAALQVAYPIGSIYTSTVSTNPNTLFGFGTWTAFGAGRVLLGDGGGFSAGATGGSKDAIAVAHTHTYSGTSGGQSASHTHGFSLAGTDVAGGGARVTVGTDAGVYTYSGNTGSASNDHTHAYSGTTASAGSSGTNANLPPYIVVYMWQRTA